MCNPSDIPAAIRDKDIPPAIGTEPGSKPWTDAYFRAQIRGAIRKVYFRWPGKLAVINRTRIEVLVRKADGKGYKKVIWHVCEQCAQYCKTQHTPKHKAALKTWKQQCAAAKKSNTELPERPEGVPYRIWCDHRDPVVSLDGEYPDWHVYLFRTFSDPLTTMWGLCDKCHHDKSQEENKERRSNVKARKSPK